MSNEGGEMGLHGNAPIIIKRKKVIAGGGHHGGAWKVAYADFVTAMMAFFMLMWLLNATTEQQRKGIADYFSPTVPINRISGGGDGMFGGENIFTQEILAQNGVGGRTDTKMPSLAMTEESREGAQIMAEVAALEKIEDVLLGNGGESILSDQALRHVITRLTDEGLIIELFDLPGAPLFQGNTDEPTADLAEINAVLGRLFGLVTNGVAISAHTASRPITLVHNPVWDLSIARAARVRTLFDDTELDPARVWRVTGKADRELVAKDPFSVRNNRIEIILLRSDAR